MRLLLPCIAALTLVLTGCAMFRENIPLREAIPWGIWESDDSTVVLFIDSDYRLNPNGVHYFVFPALHRSERGEIKAFVEFDTQRGMIGRFRPHTMSITHGRDASTRTTLLHGTHNGPLDSFRIVDGHLHFSLRDRIMIFDRVEWYTPIIVDDWLK